MKIFTGTVLVLLALNINAALIDRGNGLIYDDDLDITWLADANYAMTSGYDSDGRMTWQKATDWTVQLSFGGFSDWRLPYTPLIDSSCSMYTETDIGGGNYGSYCTGSEMGHLYYDELSGTIDAPITQSGDPDLSLFSNIQDMTSRNYWSSEKMPWGEPFGFQFFNGSTNYGGDTNGWYAWAVHDGDIGAVPIPSAVWLFGSGLIGLARRKI